MVIVLVVMWLVVLVPMLVRRHDEAADGRSADRLTSAMRVLARRSQAGGPAAAGPDDHRTEPGYLFGSSASNRVRAEARRRMLARRRRTLGTLTLLALASPAGAVTVSRWLWAAAAVAVVLLAGYVVWLRQEVRRHEERQRRRAAVFSRTTPAYPPRVARPARPARGVHPATAESARSTGRAGEGSPAGEPGSDRSWQPTPVPPPTYATMPAAHRRPPSGATSAVSLDDDDPAFAALDDVISPVERRHAVNG
jgi:hypothetical protein